MAHFAQVDKNNVVTRVLVTDNDWSEQETDDWLVTTYGGRWIQTSYNTFQGEHKFNGTPLRKNFAGIGMIYNEEIEDELMYAWDEEKQDWTEVA